MLDTSALFIGDYDHNKLVIIS